MRRVAFLLALSAGGCAMRIEPPGHVVQPATLYVLDYGMHSSVVLPCADGFVEFAYGHYDWFALNHDRWYHVPGVVLQPGRGTLGTRTLAAGENREPALPAVENAYPLVVEAARCERLREQLTSEFNTHAGEAIDNPTIGLRMTPHPRLYWHHYNCNTAVAQWLEQAGCRVTGWRQAAEFRVLSGRRAAVTAEPEPPVPARGE
jgi:hypothetical protein